MNVWRSDCLDRLISASTTSAELLKKVEIIASELEFEYCSYVMTVPAPITKPHLIWSTNYPAEWRDHYFSSKYMDTDPVVQQTTIEMRPVVWASSAIHEGQRKFWEDAGDHGIRHGWTLATHGPHMATGLLSLARSDQVITASELDEKEMKLVWLSHLIHGLVATTLMNKQVPESIYQLTDREREVLRWSAVGKTAEEIGRILGITERTVTFHMTSSFPKLDVTNKTQAVAKALLLKLL